MNYTSKQHQRIVILTDLDTVLNNYPELGITKEPVKKHTQYRLRSAESAPGVWIGESELVIILSDLENRRYDGIHQKENRETRISNIKQKYDL
jgi:hypothetical protein